MMEQQSDKDDTAMAMSSDDLQDTLQTAISATPEPVMIHEIIREDGERELERSFSALAWSGLSAGLSMGFSFLMMSVIRSVLPDQRWQSMISGFGYTTGFMIVVLGRQQLFTESTLTAVLPVLTKHSISAVLRMLRLWAVVLVANVVGTILFAWLLSVPDLFQAEVTEALSQVAQDALRDPFWPMMITAVLAGWLIALMVWLLPPIAHFSHLIAGSVEAAYLVVTHQLSATHYLTRFFVPTFIGNVLGGTSLVALLNHAPVREELDEGIAE